MIHTYHNLGEIPETPDTGTGVDARQLHLCIAAVLGLVKEVNDNVNILASKFGLESMPMDIIDMNNATTRCQSDTCNMVYEKYEKKIGLTCTTTGLPKILGKLPIDGPDVTDILTNLRELAIATAAMKTNCDEMLSLADELKESNT